MTESTVEFRVRYAETDAQGIVHHSNYLVWFEQGRSELLRNAGYPYAEVEKSGYIIVVVKAEIKYLQPAVYDDLIRLETQLIRGRGKVAKFSYKVFNQNDTLLVTAETTHMVLNRERKPCRMPEALEKAFHGNENREQR